MEVVLPNIFHVQPVNKISGTGPYLTILFWRVEFPYTRVYIQLTYSLQRWVLILGPWNFWWTGCALKVVFEVMLAMKELSRKHSSFFPGGSSFCCLRPKDLVWTHGGIHSLLSKKVNMKGTGDESLAFWLFNWDSQSKGDQFVSKGDSQFNSYGNIDLGLRFNSSTVLGRTTTEPFPQKKIIGCCSPSRGPARRTMLVLWEYHNGISGVPFMKGLNSFGCSPSQLFRCQDLQRSQIPSWNPGAAIPTPCGRRLGKSWWPLGLEQTNRPPDLPPKQGERLAGFGVFFLREGPAVWFKISLWFEMLRKLGRFPLIPETPYNVPSS